jgi:L-lactate dehydrogenase complex protein LldF
MNHCPVYVAVGGHAYGWVYPGPLGAALNPGLLGVAEAQHLARASTFCGRCEEVCPVRIPLPRIMLHWREESYRLRTAPRLERFGMSVWAFFAARPRIYRLAASLGARILGWLGRKRGRIARLPLARGWTAGRDLPAPEGATFQRRWRAARRRCS